MQRLEEGGLIVSCDFCRTDWDGQSAVIEGHRGGIICLGCLKQALGGLGPGEGAYRCVLCLRERIPPTVDRWHHPERAEPVVCKGCVLQAADVFDRDPDVAWTWEGRE